MRGSIYIKNGEDLIEMTEKPYEYERVLQEMLADYPRLLAGDEINDDDPRRLALVAREAAVPDSQGGSDRWSADHLFVDQDGIPTIVEVKRGENTEIRRKIVGQMLDYVAHATLHWDAETLRSRYNTTWEDGDRPPEEQLTEFLHDDDLETFWETVETNLRSKRVRLLFVADEIPSELKRVVEFLNEAMGDVEVFAVEVNQYVSAGEQAYVPRLYGQTEEARAASSSSTSRTGAEYVETEAELYNDLDWKLENEEISQAVYDAFVELYEFSKAIGDGIDIGGAKNANFGLQVDAHQGEYGSDPSVFTANVTGLLRVWPAKSPLDEENPAASPVAWDPRAYERFEEGFQSLVGVGEGDAEVRFDKITEADNREQFKDVVEEFVRRCRASTE